MEIKLKNREVIAVYTSHGLRDFELLGGTAKWKVNVARATACRFVICAKNSGVMPHAHGNPLVQSRTAFLIGKISVISPVEIGDPPFFMGRQFETAGRSLIAFREYAEISIPDFWSRGWLVPTVYRPEAEICELLKVRDLSELPFEPLSRAKREEIHSQAKTLAKSMEKQGRQPKLARENGLDIASAKAGLAARFGVSVENIDITIRG